MRYNRFLKPCNIRRTKNNTEKSCWVILFDKVYDVTTFMVDHPGGKDAIMLFAGKDATEEFDMLH